MEVSGKDAVDILNSFLLPRSQVHGLVVLRSTLSEARPFESSFWT